MLKDYSTTDLREIALKTSVLPMCISETGDSEIIEIIFVTAIGKLNRNGLPTSVIISKLNNTEEISKEYFVKDKELEK